MTTPDPAPAEGAPEQIPELDLLFASTEAIDSLRETQRRRVSDAQEAKVLGLGSLDKVATGRKEARAEGKAEAEASFGDLISQAVDSYIATLSQEVRDRNPDLRDDLIGILTQASINNMSDTDWALMSERRLDADGSLISSAWDVKIHELATKNAPDDSEEPPTDDEEEPTDDTEGTDIETGSRRRKRQLIGALAVAAAAGIAFMTYRYGFDSSHVAPALHGAAGSLPGGHGGGSSVAAVPTPKAPSVVPGGGGSSQNQAEAGIKVLNPRQVDELKEAWVNQVHGASENANHIMEFVTDKKGGLTIELGGEHLGTFKHMHDLRADITLNIKGHREMISVPMHGDKLHVTGKLAKLLKRDDFISVKVARLHGEHETIYSTVVGNGRELSGKTLHNLANQAAASHEQAGSAGSSATQATAKTTHGHGSTSKLNLSNAASVTSVNKQTASSWQEPAIAASGAGAALGAATVVGLRHRHHDQQRQLQEQTTADEESTKHFEVTDYVTPEQQKVINTAIRNRLKSARPIWLQPGHTVEEYTQGMEDVIRRAVEETVSDSTTIDQQNQIITRLVELYCNVSSPIETNKDPKRLYAYLDHLALADVA